MPDQKYSSLRVFAGEELIQERFLDIEQQKNFLTYLNRELKNKVGVLENQKEALADVLERGMCKAPAKAPKN